MQAQIGVWLEITNLYFSEIPPWISRFFPTCYIIQPVIAISQHDAGLSEIAWRLGILLALIIVLGIVTALFTQRRRSPE